MREEGPILPNFLPIYQGLILYVYSIGSPSINLIKWFLLRGMGNVCCNMVSCQIKPHEWTNGEEKKRHTHMRKSNIVISTTALLAVNEVERWLKILPFPSWRILKKGVKSSKIVNSNE